MSNDELTWRKSSFSNQNNGSECVEVADLADGARAVRDSKNPTGGMLSLTTDAFDAFVLGVKAGDFN